MNQPQSTSTIRWSDPARLLLLTSVIFVSMYVLLRAIFVSITHDEAFTFFYYVNKPLHDTLDVIYTNNHLLNSLLSRVTTGVFGTSEFALRLPNVICAILFFVFGARLLTRILPGRWLPLIAFLCLVLNLFVMDFLGICRGYGISIGLLIVSLYYQYRAYESDRPFLYEVFALFMTTAALLANYTLFNFFLIQIVFIIGFGVIRTLRLKNDRRKRNLTVLRYLLLTGLLTLFTVKFLKMMFRLNELGNFHFGGADGFWKDTVGSLASMSLHPVPEGQDWIAHSLAYLAGAILLLAAIAAVQFIIKKNWSAQAMFILFLFTSVFGCGIALFLQHMILHIPYSMDRTAIYFIPLFYLLALSLLSLQDKVRYVRAFVVFLFFLPLVVAQVRSFNMDRTVLWTDNMHVKEATLLMIDTAKKIHPGKSPVVVVVPFNDYPSFMYYLHVNDVNTIQIMTYNEISWLHVADLAIVNSSKPEMTVGPMFSTVSNVQDKMIAKRDGPLTATVRTVLAKIDFESNESESRPFAEGYQSKQAEVIYDLQVFSKGVRDTITDTLTTENYFECSFRMLAEECPAGVSVVLSVTRNGPAVIWRPWEVGRYARNENTWTDVCVRLYPDMPLLPGDELMIYILNYGKEKVRIDDLKIEQIQVK